MDSHPDKNNYVNENHMNTNYVNINYEMKESAKTSNGIYFTPINTKLESFTSETLRTPNVNKNGRPGKREKTIFDDQGYVIANPDADPANVKNIDSDLYPNSSTTSEQGENVTVRNLYSSINQWSKTILESIRNHQQRIVGVVLFILIFIAFIVGVSLGLKAPRTRLCVEYDVEYEGEYLRDQSPYMNIRLDECQNLCLMNDKCEAFTYRLSEGNTRSLCWTRKLVSRAVTRKGFVSAAKHCFS